MLVHQIGEEIGQRRYAPWPSRALVRLGHWRLLLRP
jgi:hypothetical protein